MLVDFWAEWCGPCKMIAPHLEAIAAELGDKVQVIKVNIDENPLTPTRYGVRGIPTLMLFKNGEVAATKVGALPKTKLLEWVAGEHLISDAGAARRGGASRYHGRPARRRSCASIRSPSSIDLLLPDLAGVLRGKRLPPGGAAQRARRRGVLHHHRLLDRHARRQRRPRAGWCGRKATPTGRCGSTPARCGRCPGARAARRSWAGIGEADGSGFFADPRHVLAQVAGALRRRSACGR